MAERPDNTQEDKANRPAGNIYERLRAPRAKGRAESMLVEGEALLAEGVVHWGIFLPSASVIAFALIFGIVFTPMLPVAVLIILMACVPGVSALIYYLTTQLILTDRRVFVRSGFFNREFIHLQLEKLESAYLEQPFVGQILGYSTVMLLGVGRGTIPVKFIVDGGAFVRRLEAQLLAGRKTS